MRRRLEEAGWSATSHWDWSLYWRPQVPSLAAYASLRPGMRVNHIPGIGAIASPRLLRSTLAQAGVEERMQGFDREGAIGRRGARWLRPNRTSYAPDDWEHVSFIDD